MRGAERVAATGPLEYGHPRRRMGKFILNSVMLGTLAIPIIMAMRVPANAKGTRRVTRVYLGFSFLYIVGVLYVMPRL
jgi:hypothetical protein